MNNFPCGFGLGLRHRVFRPADIEAGLPTASNWNLPTCRKNGEVSDSFWKDLACDVESKGWLLR